MADIVVNTENKDYKELLRQGVRAYVLQEYNSAVTALSKASELLVLEHGDDLHDSLGEVYLYYGKALLGLSREENDALGDAVPKYKDSDDEEEEEETENVETDEKEDKPAETDKEKDAGEGTSNGVTKEDTPIDGVEEESAEQGDNDDEPTDLQVAWEVLELAKKIFQKLEDKKNLAETLIVLGEISLESENFVAAINDIEEGLKMQKELFGQDSRTIAETLYKLGVAYSTNSQVDEAIKNFGESLKFLQNRINHLEKGEVKGEIEDEIKEIKSLIPDIEDKINDMKTYKDETVKKIMSAITDQKTIFEGNSSSDASSSKPASNISHLVKRKRKLEEIAEETEKEAEDSPAKKAAV